MNRFHHYSNAYNRFIRNDLLIITYPTPPYLLLREIMGPRPETPIVRFWRLKDPGVPIGGYGGGVVDVSTGTGAFSHVVLRSEMAEEPLAGASGSAQGNWAVHGNREEGDAMPEASATEQAQGKLSLEEQYHKVDNMNASIQDKGGKFLVYDKTSGKLLARSLQGQNVKHKAIFEISHFLPTRVNRTSNRVLVTLKLKNTNLYLSSSNADLNLQENAELEKNTISADNNIGPFLFLREDKLNYTTFQSIMSHQSYISTMNVEDRPVVMRSDINQVYIEMRLREEEGEGQGINNQQQGNRSNYITDTASYPYWDIHRNSRPYGLHPGVGFKFLTTGSVFVRRRTTPIFFSHTQF